MRRYGAKNVVVRGVKDGKGGRSTKINICLTVLEIILSCFHQVRLNSITENRYGLLFFI